MKRYFLLGLGLLPLAGAAQGLPDNLPPITYHVGYRALPLYQRLRDPQSLTDTLRSPDKKVPPLSEVTVVGQAAPGWAVVRLNGFLYAAPVRRLSDYDPGDADDVPVDPQTRHITYEGVVPVPGVGQAELFARARSWVPTAYTQHNAQVEREDAAAGQLRLRGTWPVVYYLTYQGVTRPVPAGVVAHTLTVYVKDGRYKYLLTDLAHDAGQATTLKSGGPLELNRSSVLGLASLGNGKAWDDVKTQGLRHARHTVESLQVAMTRQPLPPRSPKAAPAKARDPGDF